MAHGKHEYVLGAIGPVRERQGVKHLCELDEIISVVLIPGIPTPGGNHEQNYTDPGKQEDRVLETVLVSYEMSYVNVCS